MLEIRRDLVYQFLAMSCICSLVRVVTDQFPLAVRTEVQSERSPVIGRRGKITLTGPAKKAPKSASIRYPGLPRPLRPRD